MRWGRTAEATFTADFATSGGGVVDLVAPPTVEIVDPNLLVVATGVGTYVGDGTYSFTWVVPEDAALGMWKINWLGTSTDGYDMPGEEWFEVVEAGGVVTTPDDLLRLRNLVDRAFVGVPAVFTDDELHSIYLKNAKSVEAAAAEGWLIKAAIFAELVDQNEGGSDLRLSQKFRNAMTMVKHFTDKIDAAHAARAKSKRVVGKVISLRGELHDPLGVFAGGSHAGDAMYVRTYPLKRFPAIL